MRPAAAVFRGLIFTYRIFLSPFLGRQCRYLPTCSEYGDEAIRRYGGWVGSWLILARVLRCNPWGASGFDPVPDLPPDAARRPWRYARWGASHMDPASRLDR
ncbi:membrane protein insertion efficiency factor YidD [Acuticoccus mangrovi]|uniref:Putative membrane protein insertion efficiency factor n=1 Tax=Acuticoccus mangrovi TaxID=2796142 RepID=A0A934IRH5_9HYPH|nr:membrane protein insertion efficiency factor YidD [Acuticoccus mangrovi]MBJ3776319.1 membrane protein insertion efficiency factor YidD [Acuticoccus mangrovi]